MAHTDPLDRLPSDSRASTTTRHGRQLIAHYGSAAGELAACVRGVGIVDRSELSVLALHGPATHLTALLIALTGGTIAPCGASRIGGAWWCRAAPGELLVVCEGDVAGRIADRLRTAAGRFPGCTAHDHSDRYAPIGVVGHAASEVLAALGVYGEGREPRGASPFALRRVADLDVPWLLESDRMALALAERGDANAVWQAIVAVAQPFGLARVGREALDRYLLLERSAALTGINPS